MGEKSIQKKNFILEKAKAVFAAKGYKNVNMKDIVEACEISRGGLYLYYDNIADLFNDVLKMEASATDEKISKELADGKSYTDILAVFLKAQKREILQKKDNLAVAVYEYSFDKRKNNEETQRKKEFDIAVKIIERLIENGVENGEFDCEYPVLEARNMMYAIEGMKIMAQTSGITASTIDKEFAYILGSLVTEE